MAEADSPSVEPTELPDPTEPVSDPEAVAAIVAAQAAAREAASLDARDGASLDTMAEADSPVLEEAAVAKVPLYSAEGVLLNPQDCDVGHDGVVRGKHA